MLSKDNQAYNIVVFKNTQVRSEVLRGVEDKFMVNKRYIDNFTWKTCKNVGELQQLGFQILLTSNYGGPLILEHGNVVGS